MRCRHLVENTGAVHARFRMPLPRPILLLHIAVRDKSSLLFHEGVTKCDKSLSVIHCIHQNFNGNIFILQVQLHHEGHIFSF